MSIAVTGASAKILFESPSQVNLKKKLLKEGDFEIVSSNPESATNLVKGITVVRTRELTGRDATTDEPIYDYKEFPIKHPREDIADVFRRRLPRDAKGLLTVPGLTVATVAGLNTVLETYGIYLEPNEFTITKQGSAAYILKANYNCVLFFGKITITNTPAITEPLEVYEADNAGSVVVPPVVDLSTYPSVPAGTKLTINNIVYKGSNKSLFSATINSDLIINISTPAGVADSVATVYAMYNDQVVATVPFLAKANTVTQVPLRTGSTATNAAGYVFLVHSGQEPTPPTVGAPLTFKPGFTINPVKASVVSATFSGFDEGEVLNNYPTNNRSLGLNLVYANNATKPESVEWEVTGITGSSITYETSQQQNPNNTSAWQLFLTFPKNTVPSTRDITVKATVNGNIVVTKVIKVIIPTLTGSKLLDSTYNNLTAMIARGGEYIADAVQVALLEDGYIPKGPISLTTTNEYIDIEPKVGGPVNQFEVVVTNLPEGYDEVVTFVVGVDGKTFNNTVTLKYESVA